MITLDGAKILVDERIAQELSQLGTRARTVGPQFQEMVGIIDEVSHHGGKRIRPYMSMLMYEAYSGRDGSEILTAAVSQEFLHFAMLVHDDVTDQDTVRHGEKNVTGRYLDLYEDVLASPARRRREADNMAILAGDLLQARAYRLMTYIEAKPDVKRAIEDLMADTVERVIGGQVLDIQATFQGEDIDPLVIAEHKTASYTFEMPLIAGAMLADASEEQLALLREVGLKVGIGYQLMDDLLGVFGDEATTGKSAQGDLREGKRTTLINAFDRLANEKQKQKFYALFGQSLTSKEFTQARNLLVASGARKAIEKDLGRIIRSTTRLVEKLAIDSEYKIALGQLVSKGLNRQK